MKNILSIILIVALFVSCTKEEHSDAYGNFEAVEIIVSSETNGKLISFEINEGDQVQSQQRVGVIDTINLHLQKQKLIATKASVSSKIPNILSQIEVYKEQILTLKKDQKRIEELLKNKAATQKQLDDINGKINVNEKQIASIETQNSAIFSEIKSLEWSIEIINDQISKCQIELPIKGTILEKYVGESEFVGMGKALFKVANLDELELRVYISGAQLSQIKIGQKVTILIDENEDDNYSTAGVISWISSQSEFTPKIIQTKEERVKLVYAVKIKVKNDGRLKIGMPGEVIFNQ